MSRIGKMPIKVPTGVDIKIQGSNIDVKGPKGQMMFTFPPSMKLSVEEGQIHVERPSDERWDRSMHGTCRAVIANMVHGVSTGFEKSLQIEGVGYRAEMRGANLIMFVGYSHEVVFEPPQGISFEVDPRGRDVKVKGYDKQLIGQIAANIRKIRPPEPYLGKGIRYQNERIMRKAGKSGKK